MCVRITTDALAQYYTHGVIGKTSGVCELLFVLLITPLSKVCPQCQAFFELIIIPLCGFIFEFVA